jgi:hypothetical protein
LDLGEGGAGAVWGPASPGYCFPAISYARRTLAGTSRALMSRTVPPALRGALSKFSQMWARDCSSSSKSVVNFSVDNFLGLSQPLTQHPAPFSVSLEVWLPQ